MAFNIGKIPDFSRMMKVPNFKLPEYDIGGAPRKINLSHKEEEIVQKFKAWVDLIDYDLTKEDLFNFFNEWQTDKLKSVKRFVLSFTFILSFAFIAGVDLASLNLFGVEIEEERAKTFLISLLIILFASFVYYEILRRHFLDLHQAKVNSAKSALNICLDFVLQLDKIVENRDDIHTVQELLDDFRPSVDIHSNDLTTYEAIKFYNKNLKDLENRNNWIEWIELTGIYLLVFLSLLAIANSFL